MTVINIYLDVAKYMLCVHTIHITKINMYLFCLMSSGPEYDIDAAAKYIQRRFQQCNRSPKKEVYPALHHGNRHQQHGSGLPGGHQHHRQGQPGDSWFDVRESWLLGGLLREREEIQGLICDISV